MKGNKISHHSFALLKSQASCDVVSKHIHSSIITEEIESEQLLEILQFCKENGCFNRLKAIVGEELEERIKKMEGRELVYLLKKTNSSNFKEMTKWLLFSLIQIRPSEKEMIEFQLPYEVTILFPLCVSDNHLTEIFSDVLSPEKNKIDAFSSKDKLSFKEMLHMREETGDFLVKSSVDGNTQKYHKLILTSLPFFFAQSNSEMKRGNDEHLTMVSSDTFESLMKFIYSDETEHFNAFNCLELLDRENGIEFYFGGRNELVDFFEGALMSRKAINVENCLELFLKASKVGHVKLLERIKIFFSKHTELIEDLSRFTLEQQNLILKEMVRFLMAKN